MAHTSSRRKSLAISWIRHGLEVYSELGSLIGVLLVAYRAPRSLDAASLPVPSFRRSTAATRVAAHGGSIALLNIMCIIGAISVVDECMADQLVVTIFSGTAIACAGAAHRAEGRTRCRQSSLMPRPAGSATSICHRT